MKLQSSLFDEDYPDYSINKKIRLIELFAGYGSQSIAMKRLGVDFESYKAVEFDEHACHLYNVVHGTNFPVLDITKISAVDLEIKERDKYEYILFYSFPCFTGDTFILTTDGLKQIKDVKENDYVLTHAGKYEKVIASRKTGRKNIFNIKCMAANEIRCTDNHRFYVREMYRTYPTYDDGKKHKVRNFKNPEWKECKNLTKKDYLGIAINQNSIIPTWDGIDITWKNRNRIEHKSELSGLMNNHSFWWLIGRYLGDGWQRSQGGIIICSAKNETLEILPHLRNCNFHYSIVEERTVNKIHIASKELDVFVSQFGKYAIGKKLPGFVFDMPCDLLQSLIEGYVSADGYITSDLYKVSSISKELIYGFAQIVAKAYKTPYRIHKVIRKPTVIIEGRKCKQHNSYELVWKLESKKQDKAFYENGYIWCPINSITDTKEEEDVFDIEVENDHSFLANGIIAHNCTDLSVAGQQKGMSRGSKTRSGLLWEVERLMKELNADNHNLPQILIMENVSQVHSEKNMPDFQEWINFLNTLGYSSFYQDLNSKDFGVPQNRERTFMVSILGTWNFDFPEPMKLKYCMADVLEKEVEEKFFLNSERADNLIKQLLVEKKIPELPDEEK